MPRIERKVEVSASIEGVWRIISDIDNEPFYWHGTKAVHNTSKHGDTVEREIVQNFMNARISQRVTFRERESVSTEYLKGATVGTKVVAVEAIGPNRQLVRASWDIRFTGLLWLATPVISRHVVKGTENALERIRDVAEGRAPADGRPVVLATTS